MTHIDIVLKQLKRGTVKAERSIVIAGETDSKYDFSNGYETAKNAICFDFGKDDELPEGKINRLAWKLPYPIIYGEFDMETNQGPVVKFGFLANNSEHESLKGNHVIKITVFQLTHLAIPQPIYIPFSGYADEFGQLIGHGNMNCGIAVSGSLAKALTVMSCKNVETVEEKPSPIRVARAKKNKQPFFSTWTLRIKSKSCKFKNNGGKHSSPRVHLRRGHLREYRTGKYTWVQHCVVGNKKSGAVMKDYLLSP